MWTRPVWTRASFPSHAILHATYEDMPSCKRMYIYMLETSLSAMLECRRMMRPGEGVRYMIRLEFGCIFFKVPEVSLRTDEVRRGRRHILNTQSST